MIATATTGRTARHLSGVRVQGGFAPGAYVAHSTTLDRGDGPQPQPDASAPLLHGIAVGAIAARQSEADPLDAHRVVIRQTLRELAFTDDFELTSAQGVTVRMDAAGNTKVEKTGEASKGLNAAAPTVERRVSVGQGGYIVDYIVRNTGIDERGIPGVRIASVEGLLIETDPVRPLPLGRHLRRCLGAWTQFHSEARSIHVARRHRAHQRQPAATSHHPGPARAVRLGCQAAAATDRGRDRTGGDGVGRSVLRPGQRRGASAVPAGNREDCSEGARAPRRRSDHQTRAAAPRAWPSIAPSRSRRHCSRCSMPRPSRAW